MRKYEEVFSNSYEFGKHDCFSLVRDYYALTRGINLPDFERSWEEYKRFDRDLLTPHIKECGFEEINPGEAWEEGDVLLFTYPLSKHPIHMGVVIDPKKGIYLHHPSNRVQKNPESFPREEELLDKHRACISHVLRLK